MAPGRQRSNRLRSAAVKSPAKPAEEVAVQQTWARKSKRVRDAYVQGFGKLEKQNLDWAAQQAQMLQPRQSKAEASGAGWH